DRAAAHFWDVHSRRHLGARTGWANVLLGTASERAAPRWAWFCNLVEDGAYWNFLSSASLVDCQSCDGDCHHRIALDGRNGQHATSLRHQSSHRGTYRSRAHDLGIHLVRGSDRPGGHRDFHTWTDRSTHGGKLPSGV